LLANVAGVMHIDAAVDGVAGGLEVAASSVAV
jgi:hypothetical protein